MATPEDEQPNGPVVVQAADQAVSEENGVLRVTVIVNAEQPANEYRIQLLAPVFSEPGQLASVEVYWNGKQPPGWRTMRRSPA